MNEVLGGTVLSVFIEFEALSAHDLEATKESIARRIADCVIGFEEVGSVNVEVLR